MAKNVDAQMTLGSYQLLIDCRSRRKGQHTWIWRRLFQEDGDAKAAEYDKITFSWTGITNRAQAEKVQSALADALSRPLAGVEGSPVPEFAQHSEVLRSMESVAANIIEQSNNFRQELESSYQAKEAALTQRTEAFLERERTRIGQEKTRNDQEIESRKLELDTRQKDLDALQKRLDDRNNTHVRREIRSSLLDLTKERLANFNVSKQTTAQYIAVHTVSILGLIVLAGGSLYYGSKLGTDNESLAIAIKSGTLAAAAIALGSWYLGWLNRWLQRIADAEFRLQQFRLDIERASWLAETVLEWKATSSEPFPELLATRLSVGLFHAASTDVDDPKAPAAQLAEALFGAASSAKLKLGNQEVGFDRKSIRDLNKASE